MTRKIINIIIFGLFLLGLIWFISTPRQRESYLTIMGLNQSEHEYKEMGNKTPLSHKRFITKNKSLRRFSRYNGFRHPQVNFCQDEGARNPARSIKTAVFKWTDNQGVVNYSDNSPDDNSAVEKIGEIFLRGNEYFSLSLTTRGFKLPPLFKDSLNARIYVIFKFFSRHLSPNHLSPVHINLYLINGKQRFARFRDKYTSGLNTTSGFYTTKNNMAAVRWSGEKRTLQVVQHEITHLVIGNLFGNPPTWFNEGLAEFMERLESKHNITTVNLDERELIPIKEKLARNELSGFRWLINTSRKDWRNTDESLMYRYSGSVLYFLMASDTGKRLIKDYLNYLAKNRCRPLDTETFYAQHYPTGLSGMERDWQKWLLESKNKPISF